MKYRIASYCLVTMLLAPLAFAEERGNDQDTKLHSWNRFTAAGYLDERQTWWMNWPKAQRDHETACVSCHTAIPYAMARPSLRHSLGEQGLSAPEQSMLGYVSKRVTLWEQVEPFYSDEKVGPKKTIESRGTESVLNALVLARYSDPHGAMSEVEVKAFKSMWATQLTKGDEAGSWNWLNFHNAPWESDESHYYGATLAAIAVGLTPASYRQTPEATAGMSSLTSYLQQNYAEQPLVNRIVLLWAASKLPGLIDGPRRAALLQEIQGLQRMDGGWSLTDLGDWERRDKTPLDEGSDGYATGLTVYALEETGTSPGTPEMKKAITWLVDSQDAAQGRWIASSLNKKRDNDSDVGRFMSDAATSYSVLALEAVGR